MFLSRATLDLRLLNSAMLTKWYSSQQPYASHQWLWQLFPEEQERNYIYRQEPSTASQSVFYLLSKNKPWLHHNLLNVETKSFSPQLSQGMHLNFCLRANPVVTRLNKRSDVLMDAKFQAKQQSLVPENWWSVQEEAAQRWLASQGERHGFSLTPRFSLVPLAKNVTNVVAYQQQKFIRRNGEKPIMFSTVDYAGDLVVTEPGLFLNALYSGLGKSKAMGCGLIMIKRR